MNARLYDAKLHRFLAPDNFIQDPSNSQSFNRYGYVWNNPLRFTDPNGEFVVVAIIVGAVVGAYLGGSAANDNFNPFQWDWSAGSTWNGMLGGAVIGAAAGATVGFGLTAVIGVGYSSTFVSIAGYTAFATSAISSVTTAASLISDFDNGMRIFAGRFYIDENRGFWGGMLQSLSRATWEGFQSWAGYNVSHFKNMAGKVDRVDYLGGATFITNENDSRRNPDGDGNGVSLGNFININLPGEIPSNVSFEQFVLSTPLYMHEYGHTFQSERSGFGYLIGYGIPSLISAKKSTNGEHDSFWTETSANRWARRYFDERYGVVWDFPRYDLR